MNIQLNIDAQLKSKLPQIRLGIISCDVRYMKFNADLDRKINQLAEKIKKEIQLEDVSKFGPIFHTREAYKTLGKKPSRYRPSAEALHRRIIRGLGLYKLNNIVDVTNYISLETKFSIGMYDTSKIDKNVVATYGNEGENYLGIRKDELNISNLPVLADSRGKFGNPCSDSKRAMIDETTENIFMAIWSFSEEDKLKEAISFAKQCLKLYCNSTKIKTAIIKD